MEIKTLKDLHEKELKTQNNLLNSISIIYEKQNKQFENIQIQLKQLENHNINISQEFANKIKNYIKDREELLNQIKKIDTSKYAKSSKNYINQINEIINKTSLTFIEKNKLLDNLNSNVETLRNASTKEKIQIKNLINESKEYIKEEHTIKTYLSKTKISRNNLTNILSKDITSRIKFEKNYEKRLLKLQKDSKISDFTKNNAINLINTVQSKDDLNDKLKVINAYEKNIQEFIKNLPKSEQEHFKQIITVLKRNEAVKQSGEPLYNQPLVKGFLNEFKQIKILEKKSFLSAALKASKNIFKEKYLHINKGEKVFQLKNIPKLLLSSLSGILKGNGLLTENPIFIGLGEKVDNLLTDIHKNEIETKKLIEESIKASKNNNIFENKELETKPIEIKPETKPIEIKPETKPIEIKPETKPIEIKPETKSETKLIEIKPETKPIKNEKSEIKKIIKSEKIQNKLQLKSDKKEQLYLLKIKDILSLINKKFDTFFNITKNKNLQNKDENVLGIKNKILNIKDNIKTKITNTKDSISLFLKNIKDLKFLKDIKDLKFLKNIKDLKFLSKFKNIFSMFSGKNILSKGSGIFSKLGSLKNLIKMPSLLGGAGAVAEGAESIAGFGSIAGTIGTGIVSALPVAAAVAGAGAIAYFAWKHRKYIVKKLKGAWHSIKSIGKSIWKTGKNFISSGIKSISNFGLKIGKGALNIAKKYGPYLIPGYGLYKLITSKKFKQDFDKIKSKIKNKIKSLYHSVTGFFKNLFDSKKSKVNVEKEYNIIPKIKNKLNEKEDKKVINQINKSNKKISIEKNIATAFGIKTNKNYEKEEYQKDLEIFNKYKNKPQVLKKLYNYYEMQYKKHPHDENIKIALKALQQELKNNKINIVNTTKEPKKGIEDINKTKQTSVSEYKQELPKNKKTKKEESNNEIINNYNNGESKNNELQNIIITSNDALSLPNILFSMYETL